MNSFAVFLLIIVLLVVSVCGSYIYSIRYNSKIRQGNNMKYYKKRVASKEMLRREKYIMGVLKRGDIRCHRLPNTSIPYDVEKWVNSMEKFVEKPIFGQIMELKGYDIDEKHKG